MGKINYQAIYDKNRHDWYEMTNHPQKYEALLAGHYSESNHFIYELLQNAEDERANTVVFEYYSDKLVFYHNGKPFDEADVISIASMLMGTKDKTDAQTIGRFGMGFKSVYKYTCQPEIYSDETAFRIENYLLPVEIKNGWDYQSEKRNLKYQDPYSKYFCPFSEAEHLTKFVIPFKKRNEKGEIEPVSGKDVLQKLEELPAEILLFLTYIKKLYWINKSGGENAMITLEIDATDENLITCQKMEGGRDKSGKATRYLKFRKKFNHPEMKGAEVSVAYRVNNRANNINETPESDIWVYFPTRDHTQLPFIIHGSFETAVSREKLMTPSQFNDDLFDKLSDLICESMLELKKRKLITQSFIRRVLLAAFKDENDNDTIPGLKEKITQLFASEALLPDTNGNYCPVDFLKIAVPFDLADYTQNIKLVSFNNERDTNFTEYYNWLTNDLHMKLYTLQDWALDIKDQIDKSVVLDQEGIKRIRKIYTFLQKYRGSYYFDRYQYNRYVSEYEYSIRINNKDAWDALRHAPIIVNTENKLVPAYEGDTLSIYLNSSSDYKSVLRNSIVNPVLAQQFESLLKDDFKIKEFDNFQYVTEKVIKKYIDIQDHINFDNPNEFENEYVEDLKQIIDLFKTTKDVESVRELLNDAYIIKIASNENKNIFAKPYIVYAPVSDEGIDLRVYFEPITINEDEEDEGDVFSDYDLLDFEFFEKNGISVNELRQFGIITSPVKDGVRFDPGGYGVESWKALGEFCPELEVEGLTDNLHFIENHPETELAKRKSKEIFKLLCKISPKLSGTVRRRKTNPYETEEESHLSYWIKHIYAWLYDKNEDIHKVSEMSKYDLNPDIYGPLLSDNTVYESLGFIKNENDKAEKAFDVIDDLDLKEQKILFNQLARKLGVNISQSEETDSYVPEANFEFQVRDWTSSEFPSSPIKSMNSLKQHVQQQFYCANPVKYEKVWRQMRTSKNSAIVREYVTGMYTNNGNVRICQMCKRPAYTVEATEIANYGVELPQLHLCLCNNCARKYKNLRDKNKDPFRLNIKKAIEDLDISEYEDCYEIDLNEETSLSFTQTHVAELQEIFNLLDNTQDDSDQINDVKDTDEKEFDEENIEKLAQTLAEQMKKIKESNNNIEEDDNETDDIEEDSKKLTEIGAKVFNKKYGEGEVINFKDGKIYIRFQNGDERPFNLNMILKTGSITLI